jgi:glycosyltransferase involved in cell wall biosynthesis
MNSHATFIVWYSFSRRAETLAAEIRGKFVFQYEASLKARWRTLLRYIVQAWKTWRYLEQEQPDVVIVQSPPVFAPLTVAAWCKLRGRNKATGQRIPYVIDCHPGTFYDPAWKWALPILRLLSRGALVTLLCNEAAQDILRRWDVKGIFLPDGVPTLLEATGAIGSEGEARIAVICTFAGAEPIEEVFVAARLLPDVTFYVTGDPKRASPQLLSQKPDNVMLTGFLRGGVYSGLLHNVHGLMILTKQPNDLSCGAYEALSVHKPAIISDWAGSRRCFKRGFVYVQNTPEAIADGVRELLENQAQLTAEITAMRADYIRIRQPRLEEFLALVAQNVSGTLLLNTEGSVS